MDNKDKMKDILMRTDGEKLKRFRKRAEKQYDLWDTKEEYIEGITALQAVMDKHAIARDMEMLGGIVQANREDKITVEDLGEFLRWINKPNTVNIDNSEEMLDEMLELADPGASINMDKIREFQDAYDKFEEDME